jgi:hypothetical protein
MEEVVSIEGAESQLLDNSPLSSLNSLLEKNDLSDPDYVDSPNTYTPKRKKNRVSFF